MAKATSPLHPRSATINRRRALAGAAAALAGGTAAAAAAPHPLAVEPTELGREYLGTLAELRVAWTAHDGSDIDARSTAPSAKRINALMGQLERIAGRIRREPARELGQLIDRAIVACHAASVGMIGLRSEPCDPAIDLIDNVLALAQITPERCHLDA